MSCYNVMLLWEWLHLSQSPKLESFFLFPFLLHNMLTFETCWEWDRTEEELNEFQLSFFQWIPKNVITRRRTSEIYFSLWNFEIFPQAKECVHCFGCIKKPSWLTEIQTTSTGKKCSQWGNYSIFTFFLSLDFLEHARKMTFLFLCR